MSRIPKKTKFVEVVEIEHEPKYYWGKMHLCLCLECGKIFKEMRDNSVARNQFMQSLKSAQIVSGENVAVIVGNETITFVPIHLAEIQEILRRKKE